MWVSEDKSEALKRIAANPFMVEREDLEIAGVGVVFCFDSRREALRAYPRPRTKASRYVRSVPGAYYMQRDRCFTVPTQNLTELIKTLKAKDISFAVEADTGQALIQSADLRAGIIENPEGATAAELREAALTPFVERISEPGDSVRFKLQCWTTPQLKDCLPHISDFNDRMMLSRGMSGEDLKRLLCVSRFSPTHVWLTKEVNEYLSAEDSFFGLESASRAKQFGELKEFSPGLSDKGLEEKLFPHQRVAVGWLLEEPTGLLGDDMGLGKTLTVLASFKELVARDEVDFLLVISPNSLVRNWVREAKQWVPSFGIDYLPKVKQERVHYLKELNAFKAGKIVNGLVLNYEAMRLKDVSEHLMKLVGKQRVLLCIDESQRIKNPRSKTYKALEGIAAKAKRRVLLSGTPTPRDISDIWAQMKVLDGGMRLGPNYYNWLAHVAVLGTKWSRFAVRRYNKKVVKETLERVQQLLLRRRKEDVLDLPEKLFSVRDVELTGDQLERYEEIRKDLLLRVTGYGGAVFHKEIESILEEYLRAVQVASNPRLVDESWTGDPAKFLELDSLVEEIVGEQEKKLVIWTNYRTNVAELVDRYKKYGARPFTGEIGEEDRVKYVEHFQDPDSSIRILIAIPAAGGVGITLTAAQTAVYIDRTWNGEHWFQSIDRIHRIGQTGTVNIIVLNGSPVDELIGKNLKKKHENQARLLGDSGMAVEEIHPTRDELLAALGQ